MPWMWRALTRQKPIGINCSVFIKDSYEEIWNLLYSLIMASHTFGNYEGNPLNSPPVVAGVVAGSGTGAVTWFGLKKLHEFCGEDIAKEVGATTVKEAQKIAYQTLDELQNAKDSLREVNPNGMTMFHSDFREIKQVETTARNYLKRIEKALSLNEFEHAVVVCVVVGAGVIAYKMFMPDEKPDKIVDATSVHSYERARAEGLALPRL